jgi:hypothetical protein
MFNGSMDERGLRKKRQEAAPQESEYDYRLFHYAEYPLEINKMRLLFDFNNAQNQLLV